jgi:hypothetical protein
MGQPLRSVPAPDRIGHFDRKESEDERIETKPFIIIGPMPKLKLFLRRTLMRLAAGSSLSQPQTNIA